MGHNVVVKNSNSEKNDIIVSFVLHTFINLSFNLYIYIYLYIIKGVYKRELNMHIHNKEL